MRYAMSVHGGAGALERAAGEALRPRLQAGLAAALDAGEGVLAAGGAALDAVERAVRVLEDDPFFNAGRGASPTTTGALQLDAAIMDGATLRCGAAVGLKHTVNPVALARAVMERTPHVMLAGAAADRFAERAGLRTAGRDYFRDDTRPRLVEQARRASRHGTVGAVAVDSAGHLAAATSTGGVHGQMTGRVGDTPIIGAGTYADGALRRLLHRLRRGVHPPRRRRADRLHGRGGPASGGRRGRDSGPRAASGRRRTDSRRRRGRHGPAHERRQHVVRVEGRGGGRRIPAVAGGDRRLTVGRRVPRPSADRRRPTSLGVRRISRHGQTSLAVAPPTGRPSAAGLTTRAGAAILAASAGRGGKGHGHGGSTRTSTTRLRSPGGELRQASKQEHRDMKVLVVGSGGREHALAWKIAQSPLVDRLFCAPGNAGIAQVAECVDIDSGDILNLRKFARQNAIDLTVVGPEAPLTRGLVDAFRAADLRAFGPSQQAARLEGSKVFAKQLMQRHGIPTAEFRVFNGADRAKAYLDMVGPPVVVKADGLAAGKGVIVCRTIEEAKDAVDRIMIRREFGAAGEQIIVESLLEGEEASMIAFTDGRTIAVLPSTPGPQGRLRRRPRPQHRRYGRLQPRAARHRRPGRPGRARGAGADRPRHEPRGQAVPRRPLRRHHGHRRRPAGAGVQLPHGRPRDAAPDDPAEERPGPHPAGHDGRHAGGHRAGVGRAAGRLRGHGLRRLPEPLREGPPDQRPGRGRRRWRTWSSSTRARRCWTARW